ncbi:MAG TPA: hypothetical protein EYN79_01185 [Planctomycetes bacterium]|nr:hypothetical protein [Planctomycetota bacterium]
MSTAMEGRSTSPMRSTCSPISFPAGRRRHCPSPIAEPWRGRRPPTVPVSAFALDDYYDDETDDDRRGAVVAMRPVLVMVIVTIFSGAIFAQVENPANGHFYFVSDVREPIDESRLLAAHVGGVLVAVNDADEQQWIADLLLGLSHSYWLGLSDELEEGVFLWDSGEPFDYQNWQAGEPDNGNGAAPEDAARMGISSGRSWYDVSVLSSLNRPIIEYLEAPTPPVSDLEALPGIRSVTLSWQNPILYDAIDIFRQGGLIATIGGSSTEYFDPNASIPNGVYWVIGKVAQSPAVPALVFSQAIDPNYILNIPEAIVAEGESVQVSVTMTHTEPAWGWSYGICHDGGELELLSVDMGSGTAISGWGGQGPAFYAVQILPGGFAVGVIVDFDHPAMAMSERELDIATYQGLVAAPIESPLNFCATLGSPPVAVTVVSPTSQSHLPLLSDGSVEIRRREFIRADCNGDGSHDIADPLFLASYLFISGEGPPCRAACDANSDLAVDVSDVIYSLAHLFSGGSAPAAPYPLCGPEPTVSLDCASPSSCP